MICYCDGECFGNGTPNARCYGSFKIGDELPIRVEHPHCHTNNESEYQTLIELLKELSARNITGAEINCDSQLVVMTVFAHWKCRKPHLLPFQSEAKELVAKVGATLTWTPRENIVAVLGH